MYKFTDEKRRVFLEALAAVGNVTQAAKSAGLSRTIVYKRRREDEDFARDWDEAKWIGGGALEDEAIRRARDGWEVPVFHDGQKCGTVRKYSDTLLIFLLKGAMPDKYADRQKTELSNPDGTLNSAMSDAQLAAKLAALQRSVGAPPIDDDEHDCSDLV